MTSVSTTSTAAKQQPVQPPPSVQEFSIRVPKNNKKKHSVMRFKGSLKVNFKEWQHVKLERENNLRDPRENEEEIPKFGAGSEFGREAREEARKKKFGMISRKYKSEDQPWILKANGKNGKKFKGVREGGISDNAAYYVFTHAPDGAIEAYPLNEWYNFQLIQRYKALSAEEAEEEFNRRNKVMNYFNLMLKKRLRNEDEDGEDADLLDGEKKKKKPSKKEKDFKISEMEEWIDSDDDDDSDSDAKEDKKESGDESKNIKKKDLKKKKKKKNNSDSEAFEESDDGDEEGRELDYISDSSASESELESQKEMKSVAEEDALKKLLASDDEDEDEQSDKKDDEDVSDEEDGKNNEEKDKEKAAKSNDKKKDKKKSVKKESGGDSSSDTESVAEVNKTKDKNDKKPPSAQNSRAATPIAATSTSSESLKRKVNNSPDTFQAKRVKTESNYSLPSTYTSSSSDNTGITEDAVRRYLMRKPMTTTELLQKFKSKKTGLSSEQIVTVMTKILKNINPKSQKVKDKMYFSIKSPHRQQLPR